MEVLKMLEAKRLSKLVNIRETEYTEGFNPDAFKDVHNADFIEVEYACGDTISGKISSIGDITQSTNQLLNGKVLTFEHFHIATQLFNIQPYLIKNVKVNGVDIEKPLLTKKNVSINFNHDYLVGTVGVKLMKFIFTIEENKLKMYISDFIEIPPTRYKQDYCDTKHVPITIDGYISFDITSCDEIPEPDFRKLKVCETISFDIDKTWIALAPPAPTYLEDNITTRIGNIIRTLFPLAVNNK